MTFDREGYARRAATGDVAARDLLLADLMPMVVRVARLIVGPGSSAAEDAAQDALVDLQSAITQLRHPEAVTTWAIRIAYRRSIKTARREAVRRAIFSRVEESGIEDYPGRAHAIRTAFLALPPRLRAVAVLRLYAGLSELETARVLNKPRGTVKSRLNEARARLQDSLTNSGYGLEGDDT
jgi:RNA polymerase sigma-70 factor (ECF subfamily)